MKRGKGEEEEEEEEEIVEDPDLADADGGGFVLRDTGRYAHRAAYVEALAEEAGLVAVQADVVVVREEHGEPIDGVLYFFRKGRRRRGGVGRVAD